MTESGRIEWPGFALLIAEAARVPADAIQYDSRLLEDIGVDSLGLAEIVTLLVADLDMSDLLDNLDERDWTALTVGALFDEYRGGEPPTHGHLLRTG